MDKKEYDELYNSIIETPAGNIDLLIQDRLNKLLALERELASREGA